MSIILTCWDAACLEVELLILNKVKVLHNMWHTCQLIMIVSLDIITNNQIRCHSLVFCNVTGTFIYFKTIKLAVATTLVVNVRVLFNFTTWNKVV